jgi:hypothetical protein
LYRFTFSYCCTGTFQARRYSNRQYVRISDSVTTSEPYALIAKHYPSFATVKDERIPIQTLVKWEKGKTILKKIVPERTAFIREKKIAQLNPNLSLSRFEPRGKPTINILSLIFGLLLIWFASLILGIIGVAIKRPKRGFGITGICIGITAILIFVVIVIIFV